MTVSPEFADIRMSPVIIAVLLALVLWKLSSIAGRLKERFLTAKEEDYKWSQDDPLGHWEAHQDDKK
jgi:hypothetical protein